jgi:hypothetical protein
VPIFILSRHQPTPEYARWPAVTYLSDLQDAVRRAKEAAGEKNALVHGVGTVQVVRGRDATHLRHRVLR